MLRKAENWKWKVFVSLSRQWVGWQKDLSIDYLTLILVPATKISGRRKVSVITLHSIEFNWCADKEMHSLGANALSGATLPSKLFNCLISQLLQQACLTINHS